MIRIDEIYDNTFFAWLRKNRFGTRVFHCNPIGRSDPDSLICQGTTEVFEHNYILFFDAEPIQLDIHKPTFDKVKFELCQDIHERRGNDQIGTIVTSEYNSENVEQLCNIYGWKHRHYFFWGWAAMDWYRGYDTTFLMKPMSDRKITKTFIAPNRIIGGKRSHRIELLYHIFKHKLTDNWISCPAVCPVENVPIETLVKPFETLYPDIQEVFAEQPLPINFPNESGHPMHSCWLSLFNESAESLLYLVTETIATGHRQQLTEKSFKPICLQMPFVLLSAAGSLEYLRKYGFKTFGDLWDESYDLETDDHLRIVKIAELLKSLDTLTQDEKQSLFDQARPIIEHNYNHFYNGGFKEVLWAELTAMLDSIEQ